MTSVIFPRRVIMLMLPRGAYRSNWALFSLNSLISEQFVIVGVSVQTTIDHDFRSLVLQGRGRDISAIKFIHADVGFICIARIENF